MSALLFGLLVLLVIGFFVGYLPMQRREATLRAEADAQQKGLPRLPVMRVERGPDQNVLKLPGTMQALTEAPILARADGYLKRRLADIGDRVTAGQVLAEIEAPELDQQIHQAEAAVEQADASAEQAQASLAQGKANRELARMTAERTEDAGRQRHLVAAGRRSGAGAAGGAGCQRAGAREGDPRPAQQPGRGQSERGATAGRAELPPRQGAVRGVITLRNVDVGALVSTGNTLLYRIAQIGTLRTYVNVPQASVSAVHVNQAATLTVSHLPGRTFRGTVARMANALDPATRTMLVEVDVPNADGVLFPGTYANVDSSGSSPNPPLVVPAAAILFRRDGAQVAVVTPDHTVHLQKITVGRDYGDRVEILQGIAEGTTIVAVPGDAAREGVTIVPVERDAQGK